MISLKLTELPAVPFSFISICIHASYIFRRCGPCKLIEPVLEQCAQDWKHAVVVGKFDVDDANGRDLKIELILQGAMPKALPALILVHDNEILDSWKGVISPAQLEDMLEKHVVVGNEAALKSIDIAKKTQKKLVEPTYNVVSAEPRPFRGISLVN